MPKQQRALPPFDKSDSYGDVHTVPPPELIIPHSYDNMFIRADFNGVTIDENRWGDVPYLNGANTTPINMLMSPMMIMYPRRIQDGYLTESAERNYSHFIISGDGWNMPENGFNSSPWDIVQWARYVKSWGFYIIYWRGQPLLNDPYLQALVNANVVDWSIPGTEVDGKMTSEYYEVILDNTLGIVANGIPVGAHFTANYPEGFPRDTFVTNWSKFDGRVHLMWQANQNDSAGKQGAMLYYARERVNLGLVGGNGELALNSRVYAYETMASAQLQGYCNEEYGCLRSLELLYTTMRDNRIAAVSGFGNGCRYPDGSWI